MTRRQIPNGFWIAAAALALSALACGSADPDGTLADSDESELTADPRGALRAARLSVSRSALAPTLAPYVSHPDYVAANVPFVPVADLRRALEGVVDGPLKNRGEAHVTTVTPVEMGVLRKRLSSEEIEATVRASGIQKAALEPVCIGMGTKGKDHSFFLVVQSEELVRVRVALGEAYVKRGGRASDFDARAFYPHVTLGFTKRDLHESDGVKKDAKSCPRPDGLTVTR